MSHGSILIIETRLQARWSGLSVLEGVRDFFVQNIQAGSGAQSASYLLGVGFFPPVGGGTSKVVGCEGTPTSILGMTGATCLLLQYGFMA